MAVRRQLMPVAVPFDRMLRLIAASLVVTAGCAPIAPAANAPDASAVAPDRAVADNPKASGSSNGFFDFSTSVRLDYFHEGGPRGETAALDAIWQEGEWAGSRTQLIDSSGLGKYLFEVVDARSGRLLYSRGFASIYGEWETTPAVRTATRRFHESVRFPAPVAPARVILKKRDSANQFRHFWQADIAPPFFVLPEPAGVRVTQLVEHGPPVAKVDLLMIGERYGEHELGRFRSDAARLIDTLFAKEPFKSRRTDFNIRLLHKAGGAVLTEFSIFGLERYALAHDNRSLRNLAAGAPHDIVAILINESQYGGGGIYNQQSTVAAANEHAGYVFVHELGHALAGLADEYVGTVTYETGAPLITEPWEPNVTATTNPDELKWRDLVEAGTPLPTPLSFAGKVGAFEGAAYEARGLYRPEAECIMGARTLIDFCRVCRRAISRAIDTYTH